MRKFTLAAVFMIGAAAPALAGNYYIARSDGEITLGDEACPYGAGKLATYIESRSGGGGAYGCWQVKGENVQVVWKSFLGGTGSILRGSEPATYPKPEGMK